MSGQLLSTEQLRASTSKWHNLYVKAGPGSGKTTLAAEAFGYLRYVRHHRDPRGVLAATFARSAARELALRIRRRWGPKALGIPNDVCTLDSIHRRVMRHLVRSGLLTWPGGSLPETVHDRWPPESKATSKPGRRQRWFLWLDPEGDIVARWTIDKSDRRADGVVFVDEDEFMAALASGCTHRDIRNVLTAVSQAQSHPRLAQAVTDMLARTVCHLIVDEAFDMNRLDIWLVERAEAAGIPITIVGDPWQSLYEFRESRPELVAEHVANYHRLDMPGRHRFQTAEMRMLADDLSQERAFRVRSPLAAEEFDVALAHDWADLWAEVRYAVLPAAMGSDIDRRRWTQCLRVLLDAVVADRFEHDISSAQQTAAGFGLSTTEARQLVGPLVERLRRGDVNSSEAWEWLRDTMKEPGSRRWDSPGTGAARAMDRLVQVSAGDEPPILGLSVHQAKGLEWNRVLMLDRSLTTAANWGNVLRQEHETHRKTYVGLTRARQVVRVLAPSTRPPYRLPPRIEHVPLLGRRA